MNTKEKREWARYTKVAGNKELMSNIQKSIFPNLSHNESQVLALAILGGSVLYELEMHTKYSCSDKKAYTKIMQSYHAASCAYIPCQNCPFRKDKPRCSLNVSKTKAEAESNVAKVMEAYKIAYDRL